MNIFDKVTDVRRLKHELAQTQDRLQIEGKFTEVLLAQIQNRNEVIANLKDRLETKP